MECQKYYFIFVFLLLLHNSDLQTWLKRLTPEELKEVKHACSSKSEPQNRIVDGKLVSAGELTFAAVIPHGTTWCGATFISPRHLLSARHCFTDVECRGCHKIDPKQKQYLLAGGVCQDPKENWKNTDGCSRSDMVKINIELVIFDTTASFGHGDFVIIQVSDSVTKLFPQRISFACLPSHKDEPAPSTITLYGWGKTGHHKDGATTPHLRYVTVNVVQSNYRSFRISGKAPDDSPNQSIGKGDSGSGGVHFDKATDKHILWGVASSGGVGWSNLMKTSYYLDDICRHVGLCQRNGLRLSPVLKMDAVFANSEHPSAVKTGYKFRPISDELSDAIGWDCLRKQATSSIGLYECEMETSWAMAVVSANLEVLCDAISVTDQHLLTSRECILPVLKTLSKTVPQESVFVMHRSCLTEECAKYPMEDIGYSYYHDFAIIQLRSVPNPDIIPVCFLSSDGAGQLDKHEDGHARQLRAYDKILTLVKQSDFEIENQTTAEICRKNEYFCSSPVERQCNEKEPLSKLKSGAGVLEMHTFSLLGLKMDRRGSFGHAEQSAEVFRRADKILTSLCFYLNRCDQESFLFKNALYHFTKFYTTNK